MIGVFAATDVFLFYVFFEAMLIPMYFMIGSYGGAQRSYAAVKFLLYCLFGGLLMLVAVIALYVSRAAPGTTTFLFSELITLAHRARRAEVAVPRLLHRVRDQGAAVAVPHLAARRRRGGARPGPRCCWSACWTRSARSACCGTAWSCSPRRPKFFTPLVITLAVIGILYGAIAGHRPDRHQAADRLHLGLALRLHRARHLRDDQQGASGATFYMVNHGFSTGALFILAGFLIARRGSHRIADFGGVQKVAPVLAGTVPGLRPVRLSLPGLSTFVSEFLVLIGTFSRYKVAAVDRHRRHRPGRDLHPVDVPAGDERAGADEVKGMPDLGREDARGRAAARAAHRGSASTPSRCSTSSTPRSGDDDAGAPTDPKPAHPASNTLTPCRRESHRDRCPGRSATIGAPSIEYGQLAPMLVVFGAASPASWSRRSRRARPAAPRTWS